MLSTSHLNCLEMLAFSAKWTGNKHKRGFRNKNWSFREGRSLDHPLQLLLNTPGSSEGSSVTAMLRESTATPCSELIRLRGVLVLYETWVEAIDQTRILNSGSKHEAYPGGAAGKPSTRGAGECSRDPICRHPNSSSEISQARGCPR